MDGDDLWGADWLHLAYKAATANGESAEAIWHPENLFYFTTSDFDSHSIGLVAHPFAQSHHLFQYPSDEPGFNRDVLFFDNIWAANTFTKRTMHLRYPYKPVDNEKGFGIEDWSWNIETVWANIPHRVVPDTVHLHRTKEIGSLGKLNVDKGLLPPLPKDAWPKLGG